MHGVIIMLSSASVYTTLESVGQLLMYLHETKPYKIFSKMKPDAKPIFIISQK